MIGCCFGSRTCCCSEVCRNFEVWFLCVDGRLQFSVVVVREYEVSEVSNSSKSEVVVKFRFSSTLVCRACSSVTFSQCT